MSNYTEEAVHQLVNALEAAGFSPEHLTKMRSRENTTAIKAFLDGHAEVQMHKHLIDCSTQPFIPNGWSLESHRANVGTIEWDASKVELWLSKSQKGGVIEGNKLRKEIEKLDGVMNAIVLDYLLANPHLIPESWKGKAVFFWGTIYRDDFGYLYVRCLLWNGDEWSWHYGCLGSAWFDDCPAARVRK